VTVCVLCVTDYVYDAYHIVFDGLCFKCFQMVGMKQLLLLLIRMWWCLIHLSSILSSESTNHLCSALTHI